MVDGSVKSKTVYRVKNWSCNRALVARGSLTWLDDSLWKQCSPPQRGAQFVYSDQTIEWIFGACCFGACARRRALYPFGFDAVGLAAPDYRVGRQGSLAVVSRLPR